MRLERWQRRDPTLEQAWFEGDSLDAALVYADWLQAQGNPWGELISLQCRGRDAERLEVLFAELELPEQALATIGWRHGRFNWVRLGNQLDSMDESFQPVALAEQLFTLPMADGLRTLRLGFQRWGHGADDIPAVLRAAASRPFARRLRRLHVGDIAPDIDLSHFAFGNVSSVSEWFPNLVELVLRGGDPSWNRAASMDFGVLMLPHLRTLSLEMCSMSARRLEGLVASELPSLERLEVWFGAERSGALGLSGSPVLVPLLEARRFPRLSWLGLRNTEFTDALVPLVWRSSLAPQLEGLDLSMGVLSSDGATTLARLAQGSSRSGPRALPRLKVLDVRENFLLPKDVKALVEAFPGVEVRADSQKMPLEDGERYVSVAE